MSTPDSLHQEIMLQVSAKRQLLKRKAKALDWLEEHDARVGRWDGISRVHWRQGDMDRHRNGQTLLEAIEAARQAEAAGGAE
jgi:hypothetical protein